MELKAIRNNWLLCGEVCLFILTDVKTQRLNPLHQNVTMVTKQSHYKEEFFFYTSMRGP